MPDDRPPTLREAWPLMLFALLMGLGAFAAAGGMDR